MPVHPSLVHTLPFLETEFPTRSTLKSPPSFSFFPLHKRNTVYRSRPKDKRKEAKNPTISSPGCLFFWCRIIAGFWCVGRRTREAGGVVSQWGCTQDHKGVGEGLLHIWMDSCEDYMILCRFGVQRHPLCHSVQPPSGILPLPVILVFKPLKSSYLAQAPIFFFQVTLLAGWRIPVS